ncbi:MAG TPA: CHAT domain-containing protein [Armatimonadota bacterium]|nr:CHAT domain-containing protein [Armatimonadota bacterium]
MSKRHLIPFFALLACVALALAAGGQTAPNGEPAGPKPTPEVGTLTSTILDLMDGKKPDEALEVSDRARALAREKADTVGEAEALLYRSFVLRGLGRAQEGLAAAREASELYGKVGDRPMRVTALLTAMRFCAPDSAEGRELFSTALREAAGEDRRPSAIGAILEVFADGAQDRGEAERAHQAYAAALKAYGKSRLGSQPEGLYRLARLARKLNDGTAAADYLRRAAEGVEKMPDDLPTASLLCRIAVVEQGTANQFAAEGLLMRAWSIYNRLAPKSVEHARVLTALGGLMISRNDFVSAPGFLLAASDILRDLPKETGALISVYDELERWHSLGRDWKNARYYAQEILKLRERDAPDSPAHAAALRDLAKISRSEGDLHAALDFENQALQILERRAPRSAAMAACRVGLGDIRFDQKDFGGAASQYQQAIAILESRRVDPLGLAIPRTKLARALSQTGEYEAAEKAARAAWAAYLDRSEETAGEESRREFFVRAASIGRTLIECQVACGKFGDALATLEQGRAQSLRSLLLERDLAPSSANDKLWADYELAARERDRKQAELLRAGGPLSRALRRYQQAASPGTDPKEQEAAKSEYYRVLARRIEAAVAYSEVRSRAEQLWAQIRRRSPKPVPARSLAEGRSALPDGCLFVAFERAEERVYVFIADRDAAREPRGYVVEYPSKQLDADVDRFRSALSQRSPAALPQGRALFSRLFPRPAREEIRKARRLLLCPDRTLWGLPFAALVTNGSGAPTYLGLEKPLGYTPSLAVFAGEQQIREPTAGRPATLVVGDAIFSRGTTQVASATAARDTERSLLLDGTAPPPLPGTREEALSIARLYGDAPVTGEAATEAAVRERLQRADVVHLATHGYYNPDEVAASGVLLTVPKTAPDPDATGEDGVLQAWEIASQLKLHARLVVLAACETARGKSSPGEGLLGLTRALQIAGARTVVASQWKVMDSSTAVLMLTFHQRLRAGTAADEALRQAMARVHADPKTAHPFYWAAFNIVGDAAAGIRTTGGTAPRAGASGSPAAPGAGQTAPAAKKRPRGGTPGRTRAGR